MKIQIIAFIVLVLQAVTAWAQPADSLMQKSLQAYNSKKYSEAIDILEKLTAFQKQQGLESAEAYYNLANACYRNNNIARAILNYERAALFAPSDRDIEANLEFLRTKIQDKFAQKQNFFLSDIALWLQKRATSDQWTILSIVLLVALAVAAGAFLLCKKVVLRQTAFYCGLVLLIALVLSTVFAFGARNRILHRRTAIVMKDNVSAYPEPNGAEKSVFVVNSGSKVNIKAEDGDWFQVEIINGDQAWLPKNSVEII
jgi:tetratricopeptide (TPR) repeat protein